MLYNNFMILCKRITLSQPYSIQGGSYFQNFYITHNNCIFKEIQMFYKTRYYKFKPKDLYRFII